MYKNAINALNQWFPKWGGGRGTPRGGSRNYFHKSNKFGKNKIQKNSAIIVKINVKKHGS